MSLQHHAAEIYTGTSIGTACISLAAHMSQIAAEWVPIVAGIVAIVSGLVAIAYTIHKWRVGL